MRKISQTKKEPLDPIITFKPNPKASDNPLEKRFAHGMEETETRIEAVISADKQQGQPVILAGKEDMRNYVIKALEEIKAYNQDFLKEEQILDKPPQAQESEVPKATQQEVPQDNPQEPLNSAENGETKAPITTDSEDTLQQCMDKIDRDSAELKAEMQLHMDKLDRDRETVDAEFQSFLLESKAELQSYYAETQADSKEMATKLEFLTAKMNTMNRWLIALCVTTLLSIVGLVLSVVLQN